MREIDKPDFLREFRRLCRVFGRDVSTESIEDYWAALHDLPLDRFKAAVDDAIRSCSYMPVPAAIRERAGANNPTFGQHALEARRTPPRVGPGAPEQIRQELVRQCAQIGIALEPNAALANPPMDRNSWNCARCQAYHRRVQPSHWDDGRPVCRTCARNDGAHDVAGPPRPPREPGEDDA